MFFLASFIIILNCQNGNGIKSVGFEAGRRHHHHKANKTLLFNLHFQILSNEIFNDRAKIISTLLQNVNTIIKYVCMRIRQFIVNFLSSNNNNNNINNCLT